MLPYEEMVGDYVRETGNHVLYRVTPVFDGDDLVAKGVQMEAMSVEDKGEDIKFNVFVYNVQAGVKIDYESGDSEADSSMQVTTENSKASQKYHTTRIHLITAKTTAVTKIQQQQKQIQRQLLHRRSVEIADQRYTTAQVKEIMTVWEHQNI